ncbi:hypothetical protein TNCT_639071 [Trichonephila clavata]|uniref:Uncharacterized protein n=1 Tax=Trichonephila clavata TaxID=2740835 RepID=A0A8X6KI00_TRICU|nr:hypothetical protein TNCT_639071 [Trichonephila clavata]
MSNSRYSNSNAAFELHFRKAQNECGNVFPQYNKYCLANLLVAEGHYARFEESKRLRSTVTRKATVARSPARRATLSKSAWVKRSASFTLRTL